MRIRLHQLSDRAQRSAAFTLLEVIIACAIFFMVAFSVLQIVTTGLVAAKKLQQRVPDFEIIISPDALTNILVEGIKSGDFDEFVPNLYPGFSWESDTLEVGSNGFFRVDYAIYDAKAGAAKGMRMFFHKPGSPPGSATQGR
jgi:hypothetical protein